MSSQSKSEDTSLGQEEGEAGTTSTTVAVSAETKPENSLSTASSQLEDDVVDALRRIQDNQKYEAEARAFVQNLLTEKGESHVQNVLQMEIQKVKKKESELASMKKKVTATNKEVDRLRIDLRRALEAKVEAERLCKVLQSAMKRRVVLREEATKEMADHRLGIQQKVEKSVEDIRAECDERKKNVDALMKENESLREEVGQKKKDFDEAYTTHQESWKSRENYLSELMGGFQQVTKEMELLDRRLAAARFERTKTEETMELLQRQIDKYEQQFSGFSEGYSAEDAEREMAQQRQQVEARLAQLEVEKREANELRLKFDKELATWRTAHAAAKRELQKAEKARMAAEKQCRIAQEKSRLKANA